MISNKEKLATMMTNNNNAKNAPHNRKTSVEQHAPTDVDN
jgi:hypothetical protein